MLEMETLDAESKATLLCSMLRHAGLESHVIWICSYEDGLKDFPSFAMFDHALAYIPSMDLYLDPCDPGSELGVIDIDYHDRLALNITSKSNELFHTPKGDREKGVMIEMVLRPGENNSLTGTGDIVFYYQSAIEARRKMKDCDESEKAEWLNDLLFAEFEDAVHSMASLPDSLQSPEEFGLSFEIDMDNFISPGDDFPEIFIYPGNTFERAAIDSKPPRSYPVYFGSRNSNYYTVVWDFGNHFRPLSFEEISFKRGLSISGSFMAAYDEGGNQLTVTRQCKNLAPIYKPTVASKVEIVREKLKEQDITSIILERK
jgi:hypothetical protein